MNNRRFICLAALFVLGFGAVVGSSYFLNRRMTPHPRDPDPAVRVAAIRDASGTVSVNLLMEALHDEDADVRMVAVQRLHWQARDAARSVPALIETLKDPHSGIRQETAQTLAEIGPPAGPALIEALRDPNPLIRAGAALALAGVGKAMGLGRERAAGEAEAIEPILRELLQDEDPQVRRNAALALNVLDWEATASRR
jgi:HEAT repeat protein